MLNAEKYRDEIFKRAKRNKLDCNNYQFPLAFAVDEISGEALGLEKTIEWLLSEYEPPILKNGDGLKVGDWIMVRDYASGKWLKKQFAYYYGGMFYCSCANFKLDHGVCNCWKYARLPEEGE